MVQFCCTWFCKNREGKKWEAERGATAAEVCLQFSGCSLVNEVSAPPLISKASKIRNNNETPNNNMEPNSNRENPLHVFSLFLSNPFGYFSETKILKNDILFRVDEICKKYENYEVEKQRALAAFADDAFAALFTGVEDDIDKALVKSEMASTEKNRAAAVAMCAEVRRLKARLIEQVPQLQKLAKKKVKGISKEDQEARLDLVLALPDRIRAIPDGPTPAANKTGGWGPSSSNKNIKFDSSEERFDSDFYQQTEESEQFREEYEMRKMKQDEGLD